MHFVDISSELWLHGVVCFEEPRVDQHSIPLNSDCVYVYTPILQVYAVRAAERNLVHTFGAVHNTGICLYTVRRILEHCEVLQSHILNYLVLCAVRLSRKIGLYFELSI